MSKQPWAELGGPVGSVGWSVGGTHLNGASGGGGGGRGLNCLAAPASAPDTTDHGANVSCLSHGPTDHEDRDELHEGEEDAPERSEEDEEPLRRKVYAAGR